MCLSKLAEGQRGPLTSPRRAPLQRDAQPALNTARLSYGSRNLEAHEIYILPVTNPSGCWLSLSQRGDACAVCACFLRLIRR